MKCHQKYLKQKEPPKIKRLDLDSVSPGKALSELTEAERIQKRNNASAGWFITENDFQLYQLGLMSEEVWQAKRGIISHYYNQFKMKSFL